MRKSIDNFAFIDGANLHFTYENIDWELDYAKLRNYLKRKLNVTCAFYFLGKIPENEILYKDLELWGYHVKSKTPTNYMTEEEDCPYCHKVIEPELPRHKSDCDSFMTLEVITNLDSYDKAVIITSDGDFDELIKELVRKNKLQLVFAPCREGCSGLLVSSSGNRIDYIDEHRSELEKI